MNVYNVCQGISFPPQFPDVVQTAVRAYVTAVVIVNARGVGTGRRVHCSGCQCEGEVESGGRLLWYLST